MNNDISVEETKVPTPMLEPNDEHKVSKKTTKRRSYWLLKGVLISVFVGLFVYYVIFYVETHPHLTASEKQFIKEHPGYGLNGELYKLRKQEFGYLNPKETYLDYTGAGMYQIKQIKEMLKELQRHLYCNTHSLSSCSKQTEKSVENVRNMILEYFNAPKGTYSVIFTESATGALRLVGDSFPWSNRSVFLYSKHNHNSVLGIRKLAEEFGAKYETLPWDYYRHEVNIEKQMLAKDVMNLYYNVMDDNETVHNLVAFPGECNFSGVKYPLDLVQAFETGNYGAEYNEGYWHVLLDAAAFVPTNRLDLNKYPASFVTMSFYKMFGYPTGVGALLVRNDVAGLMRKQYFAGGSVVMASCDSDYCKLKPKYCERFEDGTINFQGIMSIKYGLEAIQEIGIDNIQKHVCSITIRAAQRAMQMKHSNGRKMVQIYGEHGVEDKECKKTGGILSINLLDKYGKFIGYNEIMKDLADQEFLMRAGCSCNPGACHNYLGITEEMVIESSEKRTSCGDEKDKLYGIPLGAIRISFGYPTTIEEVDSFFDHLEKKYRDFVEKEEEKGGQSMFG